MKISLPIHVVAFETDYGGVVSNTRYPEYIERARYAMMHEAGLKVQETWETYKVQPVVRKLEINYLGWARHEDALILQAEVMEHTRTTTHLAYTLMRGEQELMRARQTLAYINHQWRPTRVPAIYKDKFPAAKSS